MAETQNLNQWVAEEIRVLMTRRRIRQRALADATGLSQSALSARLTGLTPIDLHDLECIAHALGAEPIDFFPPRRGGSAAATTNERSSAGPDRTRPSGRPSTTSPRLSTRRPHRTSPVLVH